MQTEMTGKPSRTYRIRWSEKIYRFHENGISNHGPRAGAVFEIVLYPPGAEDGEVVYVGRVPQGGDCSMVLNAIRTGSGGASPAALKGIAENLANAYFDYVASGDLSSDQDLADLAQALVAQKKPRFNQPEDHPASGRWSEVKIEEL